MASEIRRYEDSVCGNCGGGGVFLHEQGDFIRYADHIAALAEQEALIVQMVEVLAKFADKKDIEGLCNDPWCDCAAYKKANSILSTARAHLSKGGTNG